MPYVTPKRPPARWLPSVSAAALVTLLTFAPLSGKRAIAQTAPNNSSALPSLTDWQESGFKPKVNTSADRTTSGATRTGSPIVIQELIALVPDHNAFGITVQPNPDLLVYLPAASSERIVRLELEAISQASTGTGLTKDLVYAQEWQVGAASGLMKLQVPAHSPNAVRPQPLMKANQDYNWTVIVYDNLDQVVGMVEGYISYRPEDQVEWQEPETLSQLAELSDYERGAYLFKNYVWYDGVAALAKAYQASPDTAATAWQQVLEVSGLSAQERQILSTEMLNGEDFITGDTL